MKPPARAPVSPHRWGILVTPIKADPCRTPMLSVGMTLDTELLSSDLGFAKILVRLSVDPVLFTLIDDRLHVLLRRRTWAPFEGVWALPGAINPAGEQLKETMLRELKR